MRNTIPIMDLANPDELIRANGAAEAAQTDRLREEASDYAQAIDQLRDLYERNNELVQKLQFLNRSQADEVRRLLADNNERVADKLAAMQDLDEKALREGIAAAVRESQDAVTETVRESQDAVTETVRNAQDAVSQTLQSSQDAVAQTVRNAQEAVLSSVREAREYARQLHQDSDDFSHKENVRVYRNIQAAMIAELDKQTRQMREQIDALQAAIKPDPAETFVRKATFGLLVAILAIQLLEGVALLSMFLSMH